MGEPNGPLITIPVYFFDKFRAIFKNTTYYVKTALAYFWAMFGKFGVIFFHFSNIYFKKYGKHEKDWGYFYSNKLFTLSVVDIWSHLKKKFFSLVSNFRFISKKIRTKKLFFVRQFPNPTSCHAKTFNLGAAKNPTTSVAASFHALYKIWMKMDRLE